MNKLEENKTALEDAQNELIDDITNIAMDEIRAKYNLNIDSDEDDHLYGEIHSQIRTYTEENNMFGNYGKPSNFDLRVSRLQAIYLLENDIVSEIMCKEYGPDSDWVGVTKDDLETIKEDDTYRTFELWK